MLRIAAAGLLSALLATGAQASAPQIKTQAPGYYRMMLGSFEVTALSDGTVDLPVDKLLTHVKPGQVERALSQAYLKTPVETSVNGYLINTGSKLVLVDTGAAGLFGPTLGRLLGNLRAAGYQPEQVDEILITHFHPDHVGGLLAEGQMAFPNAVVHAEQHEADYWLNPAEMDKAPAELKDMFKGAQLSLKPYVDAGHFKAFHGAAELLPGIRAVPAPGHTPGHSLYVAESQGRKLVFWGDLMHVAAVQFVDPAVTIAFDNDSRLAAPQRKKAYAEAAQQGFYVAGAHLAFPGLGQLKPQGAGYRFVPVNYSSKF